MSKADEVLLKFKNCIPNMDTNIINEKRKTSIHTGSHLLDFNLGIGGIPLGKVTHIYGKQGVGKTTLAISIAANAQKKYPDKKVAYIDTEHALDRNYCNTIGFNIDDFPILQPDSAEEALDLSESLIRTGEISVCIIDSVAMLVPEEEIHGDMSSYQVGLLARILGKYSRKVRSPLSITNTSLVLLNQLRTSGMGLYAKEEPCGGKAIRFLSDIEIKLRKKDKPIAIGKTVTSQLIEATIEKNKLYPPFRVAEYYIEFGKGINSTTEILEICVNDLGIIQKSGNWYTYDDKMRQNGKVNAVEFLNQNPEILNELKEQFLSGIEKWFQS